MKFKSTNEIETIQLRDAQIKEMKLVGVGEVEAEASGEGGTDGTAEMVSEVKADVAEAAGQAKKDEAASSEGLRARWMELYVEGAVVTILRTNTIQTNMPIRWRSGLRIRSSKRYCWRGISIMMQMIIW